MATKYGLKESQVIEATVEAVVSGKYKAQPNMCRELSNPDRKMFARVTGFNLDDFNAKMSEKLAAISDAIAAKISEKLGADEFKTSELAYLFSVTEDKRGTLSGRTQLQGSQVNVQINNYGTERTKDDVLASLFPPAERINASVDHDVI